MEEVGVAYVARKQYFVSNKGRTITYDEEGSLVYVSGKLRRVCYERGSVAYVLGKGVPCIQREGSFVQVTRKEVLGISRKRAPCGGWGNDSLSCKSRIRLST